MLLALLSPTKIYYQKMLEPAFCVWMHVLLIRVHRNWKLAKSLIGNDLAPTEDRSRQQAAPGGTAAICWPPQTQISRYQIDIQPQILGSIEHFLILLSTKGAVLSCNLYILYQVKRYKIKGSRVQSPHCTAVLYMVLYSISYNKLCPRSRAQFIPTKLFMS